MFVINYIAVRWNVEVYNRFVKHIEHYIGFDTVLADKDLEAKLLSVRKVLVFKIENLKKQNACIRL